MRAFAVDSRDCEYFNKPCVPCGERTVVGDVVLVVDQGARAFVQREMVFHKHCVAAVLATAPAEVTEVTEFRDRVQASLDVTGLNPIAALLSA